MHLTYSNCTCSDAIIVFKEESDRFWHEFSEYAYTLKVTEKCDIYSYGVVLLELITGKSPVQPLEQGGDLVNWVRRAIKNGVPTSDMFDKRLDLSSQTTVEEMTLLLKIALFCTSTSPVNRPTMKEVIAMLFDAKNSSLTKEPSSSPTSSDTPFEHDSSSTGLNFQPKKKLQLKTLLEKQ